MYIYICTWFIHTNGWLTLFHIHVIRRLDVEKRLQDEQCSQEKKNRQLQSLGRKESQYLRLQRTRLGLDDFITVKVIGKGAFGEASLSPPVP